MSLEANVTVIVANPGVHEAAPRLVADLQRRALVAIDVLVNNAGFGDFAGFDSAEPTKLAEMIQLNVVTLAEVARRGYLAMQAGRRVVVPGVGNWIAAVLLRFAPRRLAGDVARISIQRWGS